MACQGLECGKNVIFELDMPGFGAPDRMSQAGLLSRGLAKPSTWGAS
jgi:hypothetical protein